MKEHLFYIWSQWKLHSDAENKMWMYLRLNYDATFWLPNSW